MGPVEHFQDGILGLAEQPRIARRRVKEEHAKWLGKAYTIYRTQGICSSLGSAVQKVITEYFELQLRYLCTRVYALPRELSDLIYEYLLEDTTQDLVLDCIKARIRYRTTWKCQPYLDMNICGLGFLNDIMEIYYTKLTRVDVGSSQRHSTKDETCDFKLWTLLSKCPFGSQYTPAKYISLITIHLPLTYSDVWSADKCFSFGPPAQVNAIEGAVTMIVVKADYDDDCWGNGWGDEKTWCGFPIITQKMLMKRLERPLKRLVALGLGVKLVYGKDEEVLFP